MRAQVESITRGAILCATSRAGEAEVLARHAAAEGFEKIVAAGGDGTINEIVNGIAGQNVALGLLPVGAMNVFATELGLPANDLPRCWEIIQENRTRPVDLPSANGKHFVQLAGVGLDAQVVKETSRAFKRNFGPLSYMISAAQIASRQPPRLRIESENAVTEEGSFVLVGNGLDFKMGRAIKYPKLPHNRLLMAIAQGMGHRLERFGNPNFCAGGALTGLT